MRVSGATIGQNSMIDFKYRGKRGEGTKKKAERPKRSVFSSADYIHEK